MGDICVVFIPLTIIWLQIYVRPKYQWAEYYTSTRKLYYLVSYLLMVLMKVQYYIVYYKNFSFLSIILKQNLTTIQIISIKLRQTQTIIKK